MKKFLFLVALASLASANAFAMGKGPADRSWDQINADFNLQVAVPNYASIQFGPKGLFNVCKTETELKSIAPVRSCTEYKEVYNPGRSDHDNGGIEIVCLKWENLDVSIPREQDEQVCVAWKDISHNDNAGPPWTECTKYETRRVTLPVDFQLEVYDTRGEHGPRLAFTKPYSVPACAR